MPSRSNDPVFPITWRDLRGNDADDQSVAARLLDQLHRELGSGHILHGRNCRVLASALPADDVAVRVDDTEFAIVHLTHTSNPPEPPPWPTTELFDTQADFLVALEERHPSDGYI